MTDSSGVRIGFGIGSLKLENVYNEGERERERSIN